MEMEMESRPLGSKIIRTWCWVGGFGKWVGVKPKTTPEFLLLAMGLMETSLGGKIISSLRVCWVGVPCGPSGRNCPAGSAVQSGGRAGLEMELWEMQIITHFSTGAQQISMKCPRCSIHACRLGWNRKLIGLHLKDFFLWIEFYLLSGGGEW